MFQPQEGLLQVQGTKQGLLQLQVIEFSCIFLYHLNKFTMWFMLKNLFSILSRYGNESLLCIYIIWLKQDPCTCIWRAIAQASICDTYSLWWIHTRLSKWTAKRSTYQMSKCKCQTWSHCLVQSWLAMEQCTESQQACHAAEFQHSKNLQCQIGLVWKLKDNS